MGGALGRPSTRHTPAVTGNSQLAGTNRPHSIGDRSALPCQSLCLPELGNKHLRLVMLLPLAILLRTSPIGGVPLHGNQVCPPQLLIGRFL